MKRYDVNAVFSKPCGGCNGVHGLVFCNNGESGFPAVFRGDTCDGDVAIYATFNHNGAWTSDDILEVAALERLRVEVI